MRQSDNADQIHRPRTVLVTGGCGFIGGNLVRYLLNRDDDLRIVNIDALTYAGFRGNLADVEANYPDRYRLVHGDITDRDVVEQLFTSEPIDTVVHLAAESHVDRSIDDPQCFLKTNIWGTYNLLESSLTAWRSRKGFRFHHVSTDEVFGSIEFGYFTEQSPYDPSSPYSATKAAADHLVRAWYRTFRLPITISNASNNYGPFQLREKLVPVLITRALAEMPLPVYGDGQHVRDWLYVEDHCRAIDSVIRRAETGSTYNIGGRADVTNLELVTLLCGILDEKAPRATGSSYWDLITFVADRPGHDRRYAMDTSAIERDLGWHPEHTLEDGLAKTVDWYFEHRNWRNGTEESTERRLGMGIDRTLGEP